MSRLDYFAEKATWSLIGFLGWCLVNPKELEFGKKDEIHLTYKINLEDIKNKPELLLLRDSVSVKMLAVEALEKFQENTLKEHSNIDEDAPGNIIKIENENEKINAEELFYEIDSNTTIKFNLPKNIKEYLQDLLSGNIKNALFKIEKPLSDTKNLVTGRKTVAQILQDANVPEDAIMGLTGHKSIQGVRAYKEVNEKQHLAAMDTLIHAIEPSKSVLGDSTSINNSLNINNAIPEFSFDTQTIYHILDLFSVFFGKTISGIAFGEIMNEAHNDRAYNINHTQKPSNSGCVSKNDAILYQDEIPAVLYEQSFEPTEFMLKHQLEDFAKLTNYFIFLKYLVSVYLTDIICIGTYRIYEVFSCKIPISYSEQWQLVNIAKLGALLEELLIEQQNIKEEMSKESILNDSNTDCVYNWIKIPNNTPKSKTINK
ncbi:9756_t:CDS:2 [Entrophospora sp. SA101]|nr:9756_t:CDS:2 [Entrophospora sp. SA101]